MRVRELVSKSWLLSSVLVFGSPFALVSAHAANADNATSKRLPSVTLSNGGVQQVSTNLKTGQGLQAARVRPVSSRPLGYNAGQGSYGISCVPYARQASGIQVPGNAWQWWNNAAGTYARGDRPEIGSVLNFRANGRMQLGHVAVVKQVVNPREVIIDHANWPSGPDGRGAITRHVAVVDVSEANNWSAVRVELGRSGAFGSIYPTYGFIYKRPDTGVVVTSISRPAPQPDINPVPSDLRPVAERPWRIIEEVAEAPGGVTKRIIKRPAASIAR